MTEYTPTTDDVREAILEANEYMANHRVTESWRVIARLHATLVRLSDGQAAHDESVRAAERERIARNIEAEAPSPGSAYANAGVGYERGGMIRAARIVREGAGA